MPPYLDMKLKEEGPKDVFEGHLTIDMLKWEVPCGYGGYGLIDPPFRPPMGATLELHGDHEMIGGIVNCLYRLPRLTGKKVRITIEELP